MPAVSAPFGMRPVYHPTGLDRAHRYQNALLQGYSENIFKFQPVRLNNGLIEVTALTAQDWLGVFAGIMFFDAYGRPTYAPNWVDSATFSTAGPVWVFVWDDPGIVYEVQANGVVAETAIGDQADFAASMLTGSNLTGLSAGEIAVPLVGAGVQGMVRIIDIQLRPDNDWGDAFPIVQVQNARSQYVSNKVAI